MKSPEQFLVSIPSSRGVHFSRVLSSGQWSLVAMSLMTVLLSISCRVEPETSEIENWEVIFDGTDLDDWTPKFHRMEVGQNYRNTFRITDSLLHVAYDEYDSFNHEFGHLFYKKKYSHYRVRTEYRFLDTQLKNRPDWAFANNGIMLHSQSAESMTLNQPFPLSIEFQLLQGINRPTGKFCTPACEVEYNGSQYPNHCLEDYEGPDHPLETWVSVEAIVFGDSLVHHVVNGDTVLTYTQLKIGGDMAGGLDTVRFVTGQPLSEGYIAIQAESHDTQFKNIEVLDLCGCMDPKAANYKSYFVKNDAASCVYN